MKSQLFTDEDIELTDDIEDGVYNDRCSDDDLGFDILNVNDCTYLEGEEIELDIN